LEPETVKIKMGDRANVKIVQMYSGEVFLYTHWRGTELPTIIQSAMRKGENRWEDAQYLSRILFCEMVRGRPENELTGYGISSIVGDGDSRVLVIDCDQQQVFFPDGGTMTFREFVERDEVRW
jgi:hypothetical protein